MLTPIGFDLPQTRPPTIIAPDTLTAPDTKGLEIVAQASQGTQTLIQSRKQDIQSQAQLANATVELVASNAAQLAAANSAAARAEAAAASQTAASFRETAATLANVAQFELQKKEIKQREQQAALERLLAQRKQQQEANLAALTPKLEKFRDLWLSTDSFKTQGPNAYRDEVTKMIAEADIPVAQQDEVIRRYFEPAKDYTLRNLKETQEYTERVLKAEQRIKTTGLQQSLSASLAALNASTGRSDQEIVDAYSRVQSQIQDFYKSGGDPLETSEIVADVLAIAAERLSDVNIKTSEIRADARRHSEYAQYLAAQKAQVALGELPASTYEALARQKAAELSVPFYLPDPLTDDKATADLLKTRSTLVELQQKQALTAVEQLEATTATIGSITTSMALSPAVEATIRAQKVLDPNAKQALMIFDEFKQFREKESVAIRTEQANLSVALESQKQQLNRWLIDAQNGRATEIPVLEQLRQQGLGIPTLTQGQSVTPEQAQTIIDGYSRIQAARIGEFQVKLDAYRQRQQYFANYGLFEDQKETQKAQKVFEAAGKAYRDRLNQIKAAEATLPGNLPGQNPNFNGGVPGRPSTRQPLARGKYGGVEVTLPVRPEDLGKIDPIFDAQRFGANRYNSDGSVRSHQGLDYALPIGTPLLSLAVGTVKKVATMGGYGKIVEIDGDDGRNYFYAHLDRAAVQVGQRVDMGQKIAYSGKTGVGSGPHLHLEIMEGGKHLDPLKATTEARYGQRPAQPRTSTPTPTPPKGQPGAFFPVPNGVPLGGDKWLVGGKVTTISGQQRASSASAPAVVNLSSSRSLNEQFSETANHGYAILQKDVELAKALNNAGKELGIPTKWLADVIALESAGTFSPSIGNGRGFYGLIQFGDLAREDLGLTVQQLTSMSAAQQMKYVVKYLKLQARYAGIDRYRSIHELAGAVNQGHVMLSDIRRRGIAAVMDPRNQDGAITFREYVNKLGQYAGRKYDADPISSLRASTIHTKTVGGCTVCANLSRDDFAVHRGVS